MQVSIEGYGNKYYITDSGTVINAYTGRTLYGSPDRNGYIKVRLYKTAKEYEDHYIHRLVADNFVDIPRCYDPDSYELLTVVHRDGNKSNNASDNLEWKTFAESIHSARKIGKYSDSDNRKRIPVVGIKKSSMEFKNFDSIKDAASYIKLEQGLTSSVIVILNGIKQVLSGKTHSAYGYIWKYKGGK